MLCGRQCGPDVLNSPGPPDSYVSDNPASQRKRLPSSSVLDRVIDNCLDHADDLAKQLGPSNSVQQGANLIVMGRCDMEFANEGTDIARSTAQEYR